MSSFCVDCFSLGSHLWNDVGGAFLGKSHTHQSGFREMTLVTVLEGLFLFHLCQSNMARPPSHTHTIMLKLIN